MGSEVDRDIWGTGVVGVIRGGNGGNTPAPWACAPI